MKSLQQTIQESLETSTYESSMASFIDSKFHIEPRNLELGKKYVWFMGAEPLECTYTSKAANGWKFLLGKSEHTLSRQDVKDYIFDIGYLNENLNESVMVSKVRNQLDKDDRGQFDDAIKELKFSKNQILDKKLAEKLGKYLLNEIGSAMNDAILYLEDEFELEIE